MKNRTKNKSKLRARHRSLIILCKSGYIQMVCRYTIIVLYLPTAHQSQENIVMDNGARIEGKWFFFCHYYYFIYENCPQ